MTDNHPLWPWQTEPLQHALQQLTSHAVLLHGAPGIGQFEFALGVARSWLCEAHEPGQPHRVACGQCVSCKLIDAGSHPDLMVVLPEALQAQYGWQTDGGDDADGGAEKSGKTKKLSQEIKVDAIRAVVQFAQHTASRGRAKVVLIHPAESLNLVAANTLLKTLEEPPGMVRFALSGSALDSLLPTVRSRCQAWRLPVPAQSQAIAWLQSEISGLSEQDARMLLQASGEQPLTALERHAMGVDGRYWAQLPKEVAQGQSSKWATWPLPLQVEMLQKLCHDLACVAAGATPRYFPVDSLPAIPELSRLTAWAGELRKAQRHAEHPWNAGLKTESLLQQARMALRVKPATGARSPSP
ncbi:MAG: DNA polymerase III subunit delta' [Burkholderiales bacterium]|nr:DNA polymerase III subunit delta' [Burkholderiales bacterium]